MITGCTLNHTHTNVCHDADLALLVRKDKPQTEEGFKNPYYGMNRAQRRAMKFKRPLMHKKEYATAPEILENWRKTSG